LYQYRVPERPPKNPQLTATELTWQFSGAKVSGTVDDSRQEVTFSNQSAFELKGKLKALGMGSLRETDVTLNPGLTASLFQVEVMEGSKRLEIEMTHNDPRSLAGLYVYRAADGPEKIVGDPNASINATAMVFFDPSGSLKKQWVVDDPKPGKYIVAIDPTRVPSTGLRVHYRDLVVHPAFGNATSGDNESTVAAGSSKTVKISWTHGGIVPSGDHKLVAVAAFVSPDYGYSKLSGTRDTASEKLELLPVALITWTIAVQP
jgi:hypothetical protein